MNSEVINEDTTLKHKKAKEPKNKKRGFKPLKILSKILIVLIIVGISLSSVFTYFLGQTIGKQQAELRFLEEKSAEKKKMELDSLNKGIFVGEDKLKEVNSIIENVKLAKTFSSFAGLLSGKEIEIKLGEPGPYTLFLYEDTTYSQISETKRNSLTDKATADDFLLNHIVFGEVNSASLVNGSEFRTSNGKILKVKRDENGVFINNQKIKLRDIKSRNGIIHTLETPLPI